MRKTFVFGLIVLGATLPAVPAQAGETLCRSDGVANLCATALSTQDVVTVHYDVGQLDGPGSYQVHYVDVNNGSTSSPDNVGPLHYQEHQVGDQYGPLNHCFRVILTSNAGTTLEVGPVCE